MDRQSCYVFRFFKIYLFFVDSMAVNVNKRKCFLLFSLFYLIIYLFQGLTNNIASRSIYAALFYIWQLCISFYVVLFLFLFSYILMYVHCLCNSLYCRIQKRYFCCCPFVLYIFSYFNVNSFA